MLRKVARRFGSPAVALAVVMLTVGVAGIAQAGPGTLSKAKVKKISAKQAAKVVDQKTPGLKVAHAKKADSADQADDAASLGGVAADQFLNGREIVTEETQFTSEDKSLAGVRHLRAGLIPPAVTPRLGSPAPGRSASLAYGRP